MYYFYKILYYYYTQLYYYVMHLYYYYTQLYYYYTQLYYYYTQLYYYYTQLYYYYMQLYYHYMHLYFKTVMLKHESFGNWNSKHTILWNNFYFYKCIVYKIGSFIGLLGLIGLTFPLWKRTLLAAASMFPASQVLPAWSPSLRVHTVTQTLKY